MFGVVKLSFKAQTDIRQKDRNQGERKMYVKVIVQEDGRENGCLPASGCSVGSPAVVPSSVKIIECAMVDYSKYSVRGIDEMVKILSDKPHTIISAENKFGNNSPFEFIYMTIKPTLNDYNTWVSYAAVDCSMFVMNDKGKTVDSIVCGIPHKKVFDLDPSKK